MELQLVLKIAFCLLMFHIKAYSNPQVQLWRSFRWNRRWMLGSKASTRARGSPQSLQGGGLIVMTQFFFLLGPNSHAHYIHQVLVVQILVRCIHAPFFGRVHIRRHHNFTLENTTLEISITGNLQSSNILFFYQRLLV